MKNATAGTTSGCIIWVVVFCSIATCVTPIAATAGGFFSGSDLAVQTVGPIVCPENTTPKIDTYTTTTTDDNGFERPATGYQVQCFDANGEVVKTDPIAFAFIWIGIFAGIGLALAGILAFVFAAPTGVLTTKFLNRNKTQQPTNMY